jgi:hypothetical protein
MKSTGGIISRVSLPDVKLEKPAYVAHILYQLPRRILLQGRSKVSPRFQTLYGLIYWINKQDYNLQYSIFRTDKEECIREGNKKIGETIE